MTTFAPEPVLIATAAFAILGAIGALAGFLFAKPAWGEASAQLGFCGGLICGAILGAILIGNEEASNSVAQVSFGPWVTFSGPQPLVLELGLEGNWLKAFLVGLLGGLILIGQWIAVRSFNGNHDNAESPPGASSPGNLISATEPQASEPIPSNPAKATLPRKPLSEDMKVSCSLFYAAAAFFIFAPNLAQALLGWAAVSLLAGIVLRLSRVQAQSDRQMTASIQAAPQGFGTINPDAGLRPTKAARWTDDCQTSPSRSLRILAKLVLFLESFGLDWPWQFVSERFPNWVGEETDSLEESPASFQLLATALGSSAILLTWLIVS